MGIRKAKDVRVRYTGAKLGPEGRECAMPAADAEVLARYGIVAVVAETPKKA